ncbi:MAG: DMT family transporter [Novosphingobium sp.]
MSTPVLRSTVLTCAAMLAFAANSILCRMALERPLIDAVSFTSIRIIAGAICLVALMLLRNRKWQPSRPHWPSVICLFGYMAFFSLAYRSLSAGSGALLLFGSVQLTMLIVAISRGERLSRFAWLGLALAIGGMAYLMLPRAAAPAPYYSALMIISGMCWGLYSLLGKRADYPTSATASNFLYAVPLAILFSLAGLPHISISAEGVWLAVMSGALTSGLGYALWYQALRDIKATTAAVVQLSVPAITAIGGIIFLSETLSVHVALAITVTIGGIALVITQNAPRSPS